MGDFREYTTTSTKKCFLLQMLAKQKTLFWSISDFREYTSTKKCFLRLLAKLKTLFDILDQRVNKSIV